jgi:type IV pilus assembly protein PilQ
VSLICFSVGQIDAQNTDPRIQNLEIKLDSLQTEVPGLFKPMDFSLGQAKLNDFIRAISVANEINVSLDPNLNSTLVSQSFKNATAKNILLNLCKEYSLTIEVFGNILAIKKYNAPYRSREIVITYQKDQDLFSADFKRDSLSIASRKITKVTGKNVMFTLGLEGKRISGYVKDMPFEAAIDKIALTNNLEITKTKDNFYLFAPVSDGIARRRGLARRGNFNYQVKDTVGKILEVDFVDVPIESVINDIAFDLNINMAISEPLKNIGKATIKSDSISFNNLLTGLLENTKYTYKLEEGMYFFGKQKLASVEDVEIVTLMNRSIHAMMEPMQAADNFSSNTQFGNTFSQNGNFNGGLNPQNQNFNPQRRQNQISRNVSNQNNAQGVSDALDNIFPDGIMDSLNIKIDVEQNSFLVKGDALRIEKFKKFVKKIDKPVPLVMIEVMLIEVNKSRSVSAGIEWGIGDAPRSDLGDISSNEGLTIGSKTINRVIGGFDGIGSLNIGRVVPNFYANIQALETNGDLKVRSTPKLSALNGHVASLTNGQRTYFTQTLVNTIGVENPQQQQFVNFIPIDANLSIKIRPIVSGDGNVTLSIDVMQSSFSTGERVAEGAPPDINTSQFNSTIKVRDKDVVILGGLEVDSKSDSGSGIPFLARIPVIKWLFSKRVRTKSESKLSVIIRPTIIQN